ncbi:Hypothetical predicted protein [Mytilus galloprovincialis]|uniref:EGF-like domain-containing protein n=2 Tax=Mytilus galloprovincialis TaxID=29158 RepID=A0A8B6HQP1_MYTGA|nr:Hypothetical predicted protein [Mytilus galloprovincialis]
MGCRSISMLFLIIVLCLSFVACFPLSEKDRNWQNPLSGNTQDIMDIKNFGRQILDGNYVLQQSKNMGNTDIKREQTAEIKQKNIENLTENILDSYKEESNSSHPLTRHKRYSMSFQSVHSKLTPYLDPSFDPFYNAHVMPCSYQLRHYCLNNGVCAVVRALDIITCRCPVQYTGKRCEMIDTDYLLALFGIQ